MATGLNNKILKYATFKFMVIESLYVVLIGCDVYDLGIWHWIYDINKSNYLSTECMHVKKYGIAIKGVMFVLCLFHYAQLKWKQLPR